MSVGLVDGQLVLNPITEQRKVSKLNLTVAGSAEKIVMIEAGADEVPEDVMLDAIALAHTEIKKNGGFYRRHPGSGGQAQV